jgi:putative SOS response-associated peptidase YedK
MRWGFTLPRRLLFNVRSEGIATANFWKESFRQRRCIVPADSFFEWRTVSAAKSEAFTLLL